MSTDYFTGYMNERQKNFAGKEIFDVVESFLKGKHAETDNEDAIFINPAFAAVIDGATSKSDFRKTGKLPDSGRCSV